MGNNGDILKAILLCLVTISLLDKLLIAYC